ncbi:MAG: SprT family zinc-dependent metalloprotease [bacterium]
MNDLEQNKPSAFVYGGRTIGYVIRPGRCRFVKIIVNSPEEVEVRVPPRISSKTVHAFVVQHAEWIVREMAKQAKKPRLAPLKYATGETLFYLGKPYRLEVSQSVWKTVTREEGVLRVTLYNKANHARVKELVDEWFCKQAQTLHAKYLTETLERFGSRIRHTHCPLVMQSDAQSEGLRLTVRAMKTRWGSCSKDGHITLSTELIHAPRRLIEYVIVHELCHLEHLDHSPAFYFQLARCMPDWEERRHELDARSWRQAQMPG